MIKKIILISFVSLSICFVGISKASISIVTNIDDKIMTNHDLKKESDYLKILNPNLAELSNEQILKLAKNSLINEIFGEVP